MLLAETASDSKDMLQSEYLVTLVSEAFPSLRLRNCRLEQSGGDHVLLIVDDSLVFRFPRSGMHGLDFEIAVLKRLQHHSPVATPAYQYIDPAGRFAGYPLIEGSPLTPNRFAALAPTDQYRLLETSALFLAALHQLPRNEIAPVGQWPLTWTAAEYADQGLSEYLSTVARHMPRHACAIETFYNHYRELPSPQLVVVHGDLVAEHMLLNEENGRLSGIIDFGDVALGDPAQDFLGFWTYGMAAARQIIELYPFKEDTGLLARSRSHFIRYRLDRVIEGVTTDELDPGVAAAEIEALFSDCPPSAPQRGR